MDLVSSDYRLHIFDVIDTSTYIRNGTYWPCIYFLQALDYLCGATGAPWIFTYTLYVGSMVGATQIDSMLDE